VREDSGANPELQPACGAVCRPSLPHAVSGSVDRGWLGRVLQEQVDYLKAENHLLTVVRAISMPSPVREGRSASWARAACFLGLHNCLAGENIPPTWNTFGPIGTPSP